MKKNNLILFCLLFLTTANFAHAQQDSTYNYIYNCDSCGTFETVSFELIELETNVDISAEVLPDTSINTLAQFSSVTLRKASPSLTNIFNLNKNYLNIYPNPAKTNYFLNMVSPQECMAEIQLCDLYGRQILYYKETLHEGMNVIEQSSDKLISGNYFVKVNFNNNIFVKKLLLVK